MAGPRSPRRPRALLTAAAVAAALAVVVTGCQQSTSGSAEMPDAPDSSAPAAGLPEAADGTDLRACADGTCEVLVDTSARIQVPKRLEVADLRVRDISQHAITIVGRFLGNSMGGGCSGSGTCSSSGSGGGFELTLGPDAIATQNGLSIGLVAIDGEHAVLRLAPVR